MDGRKLIHETPDIYKNVTLPYISSHQPSLEWIYNILEHKQEDEFIIYEDADPVKGFILIPDLKWNCRKIDDLHILAIPHKRGLKSLRDLNGSHLRLLWNIRASTRWAIEHLYGLKARQLSIYLSYQPKYYHLHVHITLRSYGSSRSFLRRSHLLDNVIDNIEALPSYYQKVTLLYSLPLDHKLLKLYELNMLRRQFRELYYTQYQEIIKIKTEQNVEQAEVDLTIVKEEPKEVEEEADEVIFNPKTMEKQTFIEPIPINRIVKLENATEVTAKPIINKPNKSHKAKQSNKTRIIEKYKSQNTKKTLKEQKAKSFYKQKPKNETKLQYSETEEELILRKAVEDSIKRKLKQVDRRLAEIRKNQNLKKNVEQKSHKQSKEEELAKSYEKPKINQITRHIELESNVVKVKVEESTETPNVDAKQQMLYYQTEPNIQKPASYYQPTASSCQQTTSYYPQPNSYYQQPTSYYQQLTSYYPQPTSYYQQLTSYYQQTQASYQQSQALYQQSQASYQQSQASYQQSQATYQQSQAYSQQTLANSQQTLAYTQQTVAYTQQTVAYSQQTLAYSQQTCSYYQQPETYYHDESTSYYQHPAPY